MKKILLIANYKSSNGGISSQVDILLEKFNNANYQASLFNTKVSNLKRIFLVFPLLLKGRKYNVFHIHGCSSLGFFPIMLGVVAGKILSKKNIVTYHGGGFEDFVNKHKLLVNFFLKRANIITAPSNYIVELLNNHNYKAINIPNIIKKSNVSFKEREEITPKFVTTRSFEKVYNIKLLINAFDFIKKEYPNAELHLIGDGTLRPELELLVNQKNIKDVIFYGRVNNTKMGEALNKADIYINTSNKDNMPLSLFEAFACGLPVISTNVGGIPNFIEDEVNGYLFKPNDIEGLLIKVRKTINEQEQTKKIIEQAFELYKRYTWNFLEQDYENLYN